VSTTRRSGLRATRLGVAGVLVPVAGWSFANTIPKILDLPATTFSFWRLWLGAGLMLVVLGVTGRRPSWADIRASIPGGVLFGLNLVLFFSAIKATSIADVLVIGALQPALVLLVAGRLFGEHVDRAELGWIAVSVLGVVVFVLGSSTTPAWSLRGDLFAVASLLVWTAYFLVSKQVRRRVLAVEYMTTVTVVAAVVVTPVALLSGNSLGGLSRYDWAMILLFLAAAQAGHVMLAWAHEHVDVTLSSMLILAQPVLTAVAAWLILSEPITWAMAVGGGIAIGALVSVVRRATAEGQDIPSETAPE
jgi:drug/metabolite transporter (DMT)-like permease